MSSITKICCNLDSTIQYLTPLLPLANCHMVEFFTQNHWQKLVPKTLRQYLDSLTLENAVNIYWESCENLNNTESNTPNELSRWIKKAHSHYTSAEEDHCLSLEDFKRLLTERSCCIEPEISVTEFMNNKKSHEVQKMSSLVASLFKCTSATCCVDLGGGKGYLPITLSLGHHIPVLTVDCDEKNLRAASQRFQAMKKKWKSICKKSTEESAIHQSAKHGLHRCVTVFVTDETDLPKLCESTFPELPDDSKVLLTGLHTCGNLGPNSLRIFVSQPWVVGLINVPCCYHLLTEKIDVDLFDSFQKNYGSEVFGAEGFPMSEHLRGFNLGRNARMLAAQSIHRVVAKKQTPNKSILYRAQLQVLIKRFRPDFKISERKLKMLDCPDFQSYLCKADAILNLRLRDVITPQTMVDIEREIEKRWKEVVLFYLLRLCLAQVIENVILLDRLLFLMENGFGDAYLVKLFDPVLSPRCHSIVALR